MGSELGESQLSGVLLDNLPDNFLADTIAPSRARLTNATQHPSTNEAGCEGLLIDHTLYPIWDRHSSDVPSFADEVHDGPVFIPTLEVTEVKFGEFPATETAAQQDCQQRSVPLPFQSLRIGKLPKSSSFGCRQPVTKTNTELLGPFDPTNASRKLWAQQASISSLIS